MGQKGFTLVELLLALAIGSVITMGTMVSIQQVLIGTDRSNSQVVALADVNRAVMAIKKDLMLTQSANITDIPQSSVRLSWIDYTGFSSDNWTSHSSTYILSGTNLQRTYDGVTSIIGRHIKSVGFTKNGRVISVVITAAGSGASKREKTIEFSAYIRSEGLQE